jgi:8-oxo-dGTP diphosphatase
MTKLVGSGLIKKDGKYLLINAKRGAAKTLWNNPGGHMDDGETIEETARREIKEETGYDIEIKKLIGTYTRKVKKYVFECEIISGSLNIPEDEIADAKWFTVDEVKLLENITFGARQSVIDYDNNEFGKDYVTEIIP